MSTHTMPAQPQSSSGGRAEPLLPGWLHFLLVDILPYAVLFVVAIWLVATTTSEPTRAAARWQLFIPVVGLVATFGGWHRAGAGPRGKAVYLAQQVAHWGTLAIVIKLLFLGSMRHFLDVESDAFILIYLLGLTSILSGIYLDWNMAVFGIFLVASAITYGFMLNNLTILVSISGIAVASILLVVLIQHKVSTRLHGGSDADADG